MKEFLKKDLTLKIFSVVFAIFLWFAINPVKTEYYTVPLNVINEETLRQSGLVLNNKSYQKYVVVSVRERGNVLDRIKDTDFEVTLDLSKVKTVNDKNVPLEPPVYLGRESINLKNIDVKPKTISLDLGKIEENPFNVQIETVGKLPAGYEIISKIADPDNISIQALDTVIKSVGSVKVSVDVNGLNKSLEARKECKVYNKNGDEMPELGKKYFVNVKIEVGKRVPIIPITKGVPAKDFTEGANTAKPDKILLMGDAQALAKINDIKTEPINIEGATSTVNTQVLLQLPENVKPVDSSREVGVTVEINPLEERILQIPSDNITINGVVTDNTLLYEIIQPVTIRLKGNKVDLDKITIPALNPTINVKGLKEGTHGVPLSLIVPSVVRLADDVTVQVKITLGRIDENNNT